jgi:hypothetical protein
MSNSMQLMGLKVLLGVFASSIAVIAPCMVEAVHSDLGRWGQDVRSRGSRHHPRRLNAKIIEIIVKAAVMP